MVGLIMGASPLCVTIVSPIIGYFVSPLHQEYTLAYMYMYLHIDSLNNYYCIVLECIILVVNIGNFICYYYLSNFLFVITISLIFYLLLLSL